MLYENIPGLGKPLSRVVQGLMMLEEDNVESGFALLDAVYAGGINTFDSSSIYGGGQCDRVFGKWVRRRGLRERRARNHLAAGSSCDCTTG